MSNLDNNELLKVYKKRVRLDMLLMFICLAGCIGGIIMMILSLQGYVQQFTLATPMFIGICFVIMIYGLKSASDDQRKINEIILKEAGIKKETGASKYQSDKKKKKK